MKFARRLHTLARHHGVRTLVTSRNHVKATAEVVNIEHGFASFTEHWSPRVAGDINNFQIKLVKLQGDFVWHSHAVEDELFLVTKGTMQMKLRDPEERTALVQAGEFIIIPAGIEHCPCSDDEVECILLEPNSTINTGNVTNERTVADLNQL